MATAVAAPPTTNLLQDADLKARLQQFRQPDNLTNWYYLLRSYLLLALVIGGAVSFFAHRADWGLHWAWNVPVAVVAVVLVGAGAAPPPRPGPRGAPPHPVQNKTAQRA